MIPEQITKLFDDLAIMLIGKGYSRFSSDAILHRIRWEFAVEKGDREFKCNNNWSSTLARQFMERHPEHSGFFELRKIR